MGLAIGVDIGTTAAKAVLLSGRGELLAEAERCYSTSVKPGAIMEQDPRAWWVALRELVREMADRGTGGDSIEALSLATQGGTLVLLDDAGLPTRPAITWLDRRASAEGSQLNQQYGARFFYHRTGWRLLSSSPLVQIVWLRAHEPEAMERSSRIAFVNDYLIYRLTGLFCSDPSNCCVSMLYNPRDEEWDPELLKIARVSPRMLSPVEQTGFPVGPLTGTAAREIGLSQSVMVFNGVHDQYGASLGAGAYHEGDLLVSCGTAWAILLTAEDAVFDFPTGIIPGRHAVSGKWGIMAAISSGGVTMDWYKRILGSTDPRSDNEFYRLHTAEAAQLPAGCDGLVFLPHFAGSTAPTWEPMAQGAFVGLTLRHSATHMYRAIMEGLAFETKWNVENLERLGFRVERIIAMGGAARNDLWTRIMAEIVGKPIRVMASANAAALGAALIAGAGCGLFRGLEEGWNRLNLVQKEIVPSGRDRHVYECLFQGYKSMFRDLVSWRRNAEQ